MARRKLEVAGMLAGVEIEVAGKPYNAGQGVFTYYVRIGDKTERAQLKCADLAGLSDEAAELRFCSSVSGSKGFRRALNKLRPDTAGAAESEPAPKHRYQIRMREYVLCTVLRALAWWLFSASMAAS